MAARCSTRAVSSIPEHPMAHEQKQKSSPSASTASSRLRSVCVKMKWRASALSRLSAVRSRPGRQDSIKMCARVGGQSARAKQTRKRSTRKGMTATKKKADLRRGGGRIFGPQWKRPLLLIVGAQRCFVTSSFHPSIHPLSRHRRQSRPS